jgi:hypothetical protein
MLKAYDQLIGEKIRKSRTSSPVVLIAGEIIPIHPYTASFDSG